ncbi:MAG: glycosyltransferase [Acidobacteriota bacterium]
MSRRTERPLRMLIVGSEWPAPTFLDRLFRGLATRGIEVWIAGRGWRPRRRAFRESGLRWLGLPRLDRPLPWRLVYLAHHAGGLLVGNPLRGYELLRRSVGPRLRQSLRRADRLLPYARKPFEVFYFPWNGGAVNHPGLFHLDVATVVSCRGSQIQIAPHDPRRAVLRRGLPRTFAAATRVHCVSQAILDEALAWGLDPAKAEIIRPAVDPQLFSPADRPLRPAGGPFRFLTVGSLIWRKAFHDAIVAIHRARARGLDVRLDIVGEGPERQHLRFTIADLGLEDVVRLRGFEPPTTVRERLRAADGFVLPSLSEGISNAVLEAMATGLPTISTDCGGMAEAITSEVDGLLVPTRDPDALAEAMARVASDPDLATGLGEAARRRIERDFRLDAQLDAFARLLEGAVADQRARSR